MTSSTPMTRQELIELAALDLYGLLDDYEEALYTRSFHHAPVAVQREILELQAQIAEDTTLLPEIDPPDDLRGRVLAAVARSVEQYETGLAPIASIGSRRGNEALGPRGRQDQFRGWMRAALLSGSGQFWRAAVFVLCGAVVVLAYFRVELNERNELLVASILSGQVDAEVQALIGDDFKYFLGHPKGMCRAMRPVQGSFPGMGSLYFIDPLEEQSDEVFVLLMGVPRSSGPYTIKLTCPDGKFTLGTLTSDGKLAAARLSLAEISIDRITDATIEVLDAANAIVLTTQSA